MGPTTIDGHDASDASVAFDASKIFFLFCKQSGPVFNVYFSGCLLICNEFFPPKKKEFTPLEKLFCPFHLMFWDKKNNLKIF